MARYVWDIESKSLLDASIVDYNASPYRLRDDRWIHCVGFKNKETKEKTTFLTDDVYNGRVREFILDTATELIGHNTINFDHLAMKAAIGLDYEIGYRGAPDLVGGKPIIITDTLVMSKTLNPDRPQHSIDYFGSVLGLEKINWRAKAIELGLIQPTDPKGAEFRVFHPEMAVYMERDLDVNDRAHDFLIREWGEWDWEDAYNLEKLVKELITRQEHRGFWFNRGKAVEHVKVLDEKMEALRQVVEPLIPPKPLTKTAMKDYTPTAKQFKKNGEPTHHIANFVGKHGGKLEEVDGVWRAEMYGSMYTLPIPAVPLFTHMPATIKDTTHIKGWLVEMGWKPTAYKERDLTVDSKKKKLDKERFDDAVDRWVDQTFDGPFKRDRIDELTDVKGLGITIYHDRVMVKYKLKQHDHVKRPLKVYTNPTLTVGVEKEIDPALLSDEMKAKFQYAKEVSEYLTYSHRRNSILGGNVDPEDEEAEMEKGWLSVERINVDHRIPTPADTCGAATSRFKHRSVTNVPRVTSLFGEELRELFGVDVLAGFYQMGYDFASLEAMIESHYCVPMTAKALTKRGWKGYDELEVGELILAYNSETGFKEWTPLRGKVKYKDSLTFNLKWKSHSYRATGDHRWYVRQRDTTSKTYNLEVRTTANLNTASNVIVNAPFNKEQDVAGAVEGLSHGKYGVDWTAKVLAMSHMERVRFLEGFMIADGYWHEHKQTPVWRWAQNNGELFEAALTASYLAHDGGITVAFNTKTNDKLKVATLNVKGHITCQRMEREVYGYEDVWCPQTDLGTWVMRQGDCITITGNCWRYDDEDKAYCKSLVGEKPNDVHTLTAKKISEAIGKAFGRTPAKTVKYACAYGGSPPRVSKTVGCDLATGKLIHEAYWEAAKPLQLLADKLKTYWEKMGKKFILGIDGRKIPTRSASALINSLFQSAGVICAKRAMVLHDRKMRAEGLTVDFWKDDWKAKKFVQQLIAYHDEGQLEMHKSMIQWKLFPVSEWEVINDKGEKEPSQEAKAAEKAAKEFKKAQDKPWSEVAHSERGYYTGYCRAGELIVEAVKETSAYYKLNVTLSADYILGRNWAECH